MVYVHNNKTDEEGRELAFFPLTRSVIAVDEEAHRMIDDIVAGKEKDQLFRDYDIGDEEYNTVLEALYSQPDLRQECGGGEAAQKKRTLRRLVIHLSNDCNLRCAYCYANGGVYGSSQDLMSKEMLDRILDVFYREFDQINRIQFFGGEPLLNMDVLEYACERFRAMDRERDFHTALGLVVNGTLINRRFADLVKKYELSVTVSYDGDPAVNDQMRVFPDGSGTSEIILKKIQMLRESTGQPDTIEVTYSRNHVDAGVSILDITKNIKKQFPGIRVHVAPAGGDSGCRYVLKNLQPFVDSITELCDRAAQHPDEPMPLFTSAKQLFSDLRREGTLRRDYICGAGGNVLSVSTKGEIYPCFMLTDQKEMYLGSVWDDDVFRSEHYWAVQNRLYAYNHRPNHKECQDCFLDPFCSGCIGLNSLFEGKPFRLSPMVCEMKKKMTEEAIKGLTKIDESRERKEK